MWTTLLRVGDVRSESGQKFKKSFEDIDDDD